MPPLEGYHPEGRLPQHPSPACRKILEKNTKMAIHFTDIDAAKNHSGVVRTANDVAPLDRRIANEALRKIPDPLRKIEPNYRNADENYRNAQRGRPVTDEAMTNAERQRNYRERVKARKIS